MKLRDKHNVKAVKAETTKNVTDTLTNCLNATIYKSSYYQRIYESSGETEFVDSKSRAHKILLRYAHNHWVGKGMVRNDAE